MACRGEKPREFSQSNFSYSGPMTANIQLGNLAVKPQVRRSELEAKMEKITSDKFINKQAWREPRKGHDALKSVV